MPNHPLVHPLAQAMWEGLGILGFDLEGDSRPHMSDEQLIKWFTACVTEMRKDYDEALDEIPTVTAVGETPRCSLACPIYTCPSSRERECLMHGGFDQCCDHPDCPGFIFKRRPIEPDVLSVAVGNNERSPWGDDRTCPECGEPNLPLENQATTDGAVVLHFISHCGKSWMRGPIEKL